MKVSMVAPLEISQIVGGLRTQLMETSRYLPEHGIEVDFYDPWCVYNTDTVDLYHLFGADMGTYQLAKTLGEYKQPFVISPILYSNHTPRFIRWSQKIERWSKMVVSGLWSDYAVIGEICRQSTAVFPNTGAEADLIEEGFEIDRSKISIIPNGVESRFLEATPDLFQETYGCSDFVLYVGMIGSPRKNVYRLIEALKDLNRTVIFIGKTFNNSRGEKCRDTIASYSHMHLLDPIPHESHLLASAYAASSVLVLPSYYETPGIAAMEAALTGSGIAITGYGGTQEYFQQYAHYLEPESVTSIKKAVNHALKTPHTPELQEHIKKHYLWPHVAAQTANTYKKLDLHES